MIDPLYDPLSMLPAGLVLTRELQDGILAAYAANGGQPLTTAQVQAVTGAPLPFPSFLQRLPDSNPQGRGAPWMPPVLPKSNGPAELGAFLLGQNELA